MLAGLEEIDEGEIYIGDRLVNDVPPKDRDIAMVFQSYALYPHMTVYDNMAFGLKLRKVPCWTLTVASRRLPPRWVSSRCSIASPSSSPADSVNACRRARDRPRTQRLPDG